MAEKMVKTFMVISNLLESRELLVASRDSIVSLADSSVFQTRMLVPIRSWKYGRRECSINLYSFCAKDSMTERWGLSVRRKFRMSR